MDTIITLEMISNIKNILGHGIIVAFCSSENDDMQILNRVKCTSFKDIKQKISDMHQYKVFRIDVLNDQMCVYTVQV